jgi:HK97 gp10 family phage protein
MGMATIKVAVEGVQEFGFLVNEIVNDFGHKDAKKIMVSSARLSMRPVLEMARRLAPVDTGALAVSLQVEARKPNSKDKRSKYVADTDVAIAAVTTAPGKKLAKKKFLNKRTNQKQTGIQSDARATANEFGTAKMGAQPFMRPALESRSATVVTNLGNSLRKSLEKYKARQAKKAKL